MVVSHDEQYMGTLLKLNWLPMGPLCLGSNFWRQDNVHAAMPSFAGGFSSPLGTKLCSNTHQAPSRRH